MMYLHVCSDAYTCNFLFFNKFLYLFDFFFSEGEYDFPEPWLIFGLKNVKEVFGAFCMCVVFLINEYNVEK